MKKKYLITSALPYINGIKHLGNLVGSILPADIYARFLKQSGHDVLFICGTDEHGTPAEIAAHEANISIEDYCLKMHDLQKSIYKKFDINFDYFGRSSDLSNHDLTQKIYKKLKENNCIIQTNINQYYSHFDKRFLPDRYIEGQCPFCGFDKARGDQCDGCSHLLSPEDLISPYSSISGSTDIELKSTKHLFIDLPKIQDQLKTWVDSRTEWSDLVTGIAHKWLKEGLQSRCITRDLTWGVSVPEDGYEGKVFYVWFDAPNAYISITKDWAKQHGDHTEWEKWWLNSQESVHYTQFMAKDNVPFHAIFWPSILLSADMGFKLVDNIKSFHWLTYEKGKFSTSRKRGVFTDQALELYSADYWRYYLISNCPETSDSDFSFTHFASVVNKDLADILGNFLNRTLSLIAKYYDGQIPCTLDSHLIDRTLLSQASEIVGEIHKNLSALKFRPATQMLRSLWVLGNTYITTHEPWTVLKHDKDAAGVVLTHCIHMLKVFAAVSHPFIPKTSSHILDLLNDPDFDKKDELSCDNCLDFTYFKAGHLIKAPQRLFEKIDDETVKNLADRFSGTTNANHE